MNLLTRKMDDVILEMLRQNPQHTAKSIAKSRGWKLHTVTQRMAIMSKAGMIENIRMWVVLDEVEK